MFISNGTGHVANRKGVASMIRRFCYSVYQFMRYYAALKPDFHQVHTQAECVTNITVDTLQKVQVLVLDFDGVLAPHGALAPLPEVQVWLTDFIKTCEIPVYILSNKPNSQRAAWFAQHYPAITFVAGVRKKPYPDGLHKIADMTKVPLSQILLVDDRLATGILATKIAGCQSLLIMHPYQNRQAHPLKEKFFAFLRAAEQWMVH